MKKSAHNSTNRLLIKYFLKVIIISIIAVLFFTFIFSEIVYKLDLELESNYIFSILSVFFSGALISFVSVYSIKNNGALMGVIAELPLILFCLINLIINENSFVLFLIKTVISLLTGALCGIIATKKSGKCLTRTKN